MSLLITCLYRLHVFTDYTWINVDSKYKWSIKNSTFIATIYLKGLLIRKGLVVSLIWYNIHVHVNIFTIGEL